MSKSILNLGLLTIAFGLHLNASAAFTNDIKAESLITGKPVSIAPQDKTGKGSVVIFMSSRCPCSDSHVAIVKKLATEYKDFKFIVVHSNLEETKEEAQAYFKKAGFDFEVLQDEKTKIADDFKALKTPHAFLLNPQGEIIYQGGVTSSARAGRADRIYLEEVLSDVKAGKKPRLSEGRTLGCAIARESDKNVW